MINMIVLAFFAVSMIAGVAVLAISVCAISSEISRREEMEDAYDKDK